MFRYKYNNNLLFSTLTQHMVTCVVVCTDYLTVHNYKCSDVFSRMECGWELVTPLYELCLISIYI